MVYQGKVQGGVVVLENGAVLPEGTPVTVLANDRVPGTGAADGAPSIGEKMLQLAHWAETQPCTLPEDLAANHDHYLHGLPKRK